MQLYKHKDTTDVAIMPIAYLTGRKIRVIWFNIVNPLNVQQVKPDTIEIKHEDMKNWVPYYPEI